MIKNVLTKFASVSFLSGNVFCIRHICPATACASCRHWPLQEVQQKSNE